MKRTVALLLLVLAACATESAPGWRGGIAAFHKAIAACEADPTVDVEACMKRANYVRVLDHGCPSGADAHKLRDTDCWGQFDPAVPEVLTAGQNPN
jgi:hypothetical protein